MVANVLNVVVLRGLIVVATSVILDIIFVVNGAFADTFVSTDVARVVNCLVFPYILIVATAACRRSDGAATPTEQR